MESASLQARMFGVLTAVSLALALEAGPMAHAQQSSSAKASLEFEVATVKPCEPGQRIAWEMRVYPGGRLVIHGHNLRELISEAFNIPAWQVIAGDKWMVEQRFNVEGKPPEQLRNSVTGEFSNGSIQDARERSMLQALLIERFHLKTHTESKPGTVYLLKRGDGTLRLEQAELDLYKHLQDGSVVPNDPYPTGDLGMVSGKPISMRKTSMLQLAQMLGEIQNAPVIDQTAMQGFYNFRSQTVLSNEDFANGSPARLYVEVLPEMGLKLVKSEGSVEKLVVDSAEMPTGN